MTTAKERPILFNGEMVRAILDGSKTQTRRILKLPPMQPWQSGSKGWRFIECDHSIEDCDNFVAGFSDGQGTIINIKCPYGKPADPLFGRPADRLWVRETHRYWWPDSEDPGSNPCRCHYKADDAILDLPVSWDEGPFFNSPEYHSLDVEPTKWRPSIFMPRWASRILLEITAIRVERLNAISEADARAEGIADGGCLNCGESEPCGCANPQPDARDGFAWLWQSINGPSSWHANPWAWVLEFRRVQP